MTERERLIELIQKAHDEQRYLTSDKSIKAIADHLLANNVRVELPRNDVSLVDGHIEE